jgi:hypothetical protein
MVAPDAIEARPQSFGAEGPHFCYRMSGLGIGHSGLEYDIIEK